MKRKLPECIFVNRYGLRFGRSRNPVTYQSGRRWNAYYTHVCLRCGWAFKPPRHKSHKISDCNIVVSQHGLRDVAAFLRRNLFGTRRRA